MTSGSGESAGATIFDRYAAWYDAFNIAKDYDAETAYLLEVVQLRRPFPRSWLDVGCGTGHHLASLSARGISVEGADVSASMVARARAAHPGISFHVGSAQQFDLRGDRDVISMLFHAMSYQTSDAMVHGALENIAGHLAPGGVFLFDYWHTEAVLRDPPASRVRAASVDSRTLFRFTYPTEDRARRLISVRFEFRWDSPTGPLAHEEVHLMRHFGAEELTDYLASAGLKVLSNTAWMQQRALRPDDWYGLICACPKVD